jgi:uncharacterized protein
VICLGCHQIRDRSAQTACCGSGEGSIATGSPPIGTLDYDKRGEAMAKIGERLGVDIISAMKAKEQDKLTTLRMVKSAFKSREIDKREPLTDAEEQSIITTLLKQRRESIEQFTKGNRPELAAKEQVEIELIDAYMPKAASAEDILATVQGAVEQITKDNGGTRPGPRDMGAVMKVAQQRILADGIRADGKLVSELIKAELAKGA